MENTATDIRLKIHDQTYTTKEIFEKENENVTTDPINFKKFWINFNNGSISLGTGEFIKENEFLKWQDPYPIKNIKYIGISSGNDDITYRSINVGPPLEEAEKFIKSGQWSPEIKLETIEREATKTETRIASDEEEEYEDDEEEEYEDDEEEAEDDDENSEDEDDEEYEDDDDEDEESDEEEYEEDDE